MICFTLCHISCTLLLQYIVKLIAIDKGIHCIQYNAALVDSLKFQLTILT